MNACLSIGLKVFSRNTAILLLLVVGSNFAAHAGVRVIIDTDEPVGDFVIRCQWHSDFLNLHGGKKLVKEKVFVTASGKPTDCGWSLFGEGPSAEVMHPLYVTVLGCAFDSMCNTPYSSYDENSITIRPVSIEQHLDELVKQHQGDDLSQAVKGFVAAHFDKAYFRYYRSVKKIDMAYFRETYTERLKQFWQRAISTNAFGKGLSDPDVAIEAYWKKAK